ncbi:PREDICTED: immunoglobulin-binding protein 1b [Cyphomyrmex costatus]|uniref:Immunoglobulin-binding protein 1b n=1 Tax=Cyphomyrmex costatus TaxID=456900 RepID=A0A151IDZ4_9HYME|nr:PREDICTED: immunoglobulin-binding protein 1b [Cyphomyrmex costatus]KYM98892.1 Immunoglobulin-binding protein 1b [Cyphomyrmex costatus]
MSEKLLLKGLSPLTKRDKNDSATLSELFDSAFELFNSINATVEPTNSSKVQLDIKRTMRMFEDATRLVSIVDMFSDNESFDEVATENIKYFLLPALLGKLTNQLCTTDDRMHLVKVAEVYFVDFLKRLKAYNLVTDVEIPEISSIDEKKEAGDNENTSESRMLENMVIRRNTKLQRYQQEKDLESRLDTLKKNFDNPNIDDELKREYFITLIKLYAVQIVDDLNLLKREEAILENMKEMKPMHTLTSEIQKKQKLPVPKLQPIIITRDELQKKVFGAGYPSLPVLTVQEFYEQRVKDGDWPNPSQHNATNSRCLQNMANKSVIGNNEDSETVLKEEKEEKDDPEYLERQRAMDEYKDTHRRGWGNRANRS